MNIDEQESATNIKFNFKHLELNLEIPEVVVNWMSNRALSLQTTINSFAAHVLTTVFANEMGYLQDITNHQKPENNETPQTQA